MTDDDDDDEEEEEEVHVAQCLCVLCKLETTTES